MKLNLRQSLSFPCITLACMTLACAAPGFAQGRGGRGGSGRGGAAAGPSLVAGRFKGYPAEAVTAGTTAYNTKCGYCHGDRAKGGNAGPDLIASDVSLHDEDGVGLGEYLNGAAHTKVLKNDLDKQTIYNIAAYIHSRIIYSATTRGATSPEAVLKAGDAKAGEAYFNGAGGCSKCHSVSGDLKGIGGKYDAVALQDKIVNPRSGAFGRGGRGRGGRGGRGGAEAPPDPNAITATVTLPGGKTVTGIPLRLTDFDVTLRLADGTMQTWTRENGNPKVERHDPLQAHVDIMTKLTDKQMHDLTAYLATIK